MSYGMKIRNQEWIEEEDALVITLIQPFWGAYKIFNWPLKVEGFGVSIEAVDKAIALKKKIRIKLIRFGVYEISSKKALEIGSKYKFTARDNKQLYIIPRNECTKLQ